MGLGLGVLSELGLLGVEGSELAGLPGLGDKEVTSECFEDGPLSISSDGGGVGEGLSLVSLEKGSVSGEIFRLNRRFMLRGSFTSCRFQLFGGFSISFPLFDTSG